MPNYQHVKALSWNIGKALTLRVRQHMSYRDIGRILGVDHSVVYAGLRGFTAILEQPELIGAYRDSEADILDGLRMELVRSLIDDLRVKKGKGKLSGYQKVGMYGILFDKMRLLRGQTTSNISSLTAIIQAAHGVGKHEIEVTEPDKPVDNSPDDQPDVVLPDEPQ